ncbi:MAG: hypothetical protein IJP07_03720 [Firmicutes bacterium]|nr:hypothetical protein [Bacillota bacterium]
MRRYQVFVGNFGSGKTELALHFAYHSAVKGENVTLVDLDIVNPYFRAAERKKTMEAAGIRLIVPNFAMDNVEIITIDPAIYSAFVGDMGRAVFDVGGDGIGARALGQYKAYFDRIPKEMMDVWLVVNPYRPLSSTPELITSLKDKIESASRLTVNGIINNSNLSYETKAEDLLWGYEIVRQAAIDSELPVVYTSGTQAVLDEFWPLTEEKGLDKKYLGEPLPIDIRMHRDWERFAKFGVEDR